MPASPRTLRPRLRNSGNLRAIMQTDYLNWLGIPVRSLMERRDMPRTSVHGFAGVSDATTRAPDGKASLCLFISSLHTFIASLYERLLLADIRFFIQPINCTII
jgi:hypothetical protein